MDGTVDVVRSPFGVIVADDSKGFVEVLPNFCLADQRTVEFLSVVVSFSL